MLLTFPAGSVVVGWSLRVVQWPSTMNLYSTVLSQGICAVPEKSEAPFVRCMEDDHYRTAATVSNRPLRLRMKSKSALPGRMFQ